MLDSPEKTRAEKEIIHYLFEIHNQNCKTNELLEKILAEIRYVKKEVR